MPLDLQLVIATNAIIAACYFAIFTLIFVGLVTQRRLGFNALGTATAFIFTCALGHAVHAEHYWIEAPAYASDALDLSHQAIADGITVIPAVIPPSRHP